MLSLGIVLLFLAPLSACSILRCEAANEKGGGAVRFGGEEPASGTNAVRGEILVKFKPSTGEDRVREIAASEGLEIVRVVRPPSLYLMKSRTAEAGRAIPALKKYTEIEYAEPNYIYRPGRN